MLVTMTVGKAGRPIHEDARAKIRPRIFLEGNFFVDLEPGTPGAAEIADDATIPINQTAVPVQFDQLLTSLQSDTREDLKTLLDEYGNALDKGGAEAFNRSIPYWKSAYRDTAIVNEASLGETEHDLSGYVKNAGATAAALDRHPEQLKSLITDFNTTAAAFAREQGNLRTRSPSCRARCAPPSPRSASLNAAFPPLRAFTADLRPGVRSSEAALDASIPLVRQLRGLVSEDELRGLAADLRPTIPALARLTRESIPLAEQNRLLASCQNEVVLPWAQGQGRGQAVPGPGPGLQRGAEGVPRPRGREPLRRRQRPVVPRPGRRRHEPRAARARRVRHDDEPDPRRQPAEAEGAPAAGRVAAVREPGDAGPAQPAGRPAAAVEGRHEHAGVQGPLRARQGPRRRLAQGPAQARGGSPTSSRSPTRTPRRA